MTRSPRRCHPASWCPSHRFGRRLLAAWLAMLLLLPAPLAAQTPPPQGPQDESSQERQQGPRVIRELLSFPTVNIVEPRNGEIVTRQDVTVTITFRDPRDELDVASFRVFVNGVDRTQQFQVSTGGATWRPETRRTTEAGREVALERQGADQQGRQQSAETQATFLEGQNTIVASIKNLSGNMATTSAAFILDTATLLRGRAIPRSPLEQAFLQAPTPHPSETVRRGMPSGPIISRDLTQFGYEAFRTLLPNIAPAAHLPVDPTYTLGSGDSLILYIWNVPGSTLYDSVSLLLDRTGAVFVPRVGAVPLQGLTVAQAEEVLRSRVSRYYSGFELRLTLAELRAISVYAMGEVARPGSYSVSPFSTVLDVLVVAGGPSKMGSLRSIRVTRNGQTIGEVDAYDFLLQGNRPGGVRLQSGDTIFVPPIGPVAAAAGEVKRPGIYELRPGTTVAMLIAMAGGPLPTAGLARVQVERLQGAQGRQVLDLPFVGERGGGGSEVLQDGDLVRIFPGPDRLENAVTLEGFVRTPGTYEWRPGMRISDLLSPDSLLPEAYRERVEIARLRPDFSREVLSINLKQAWGLPADASQDLLLQPHDKISVQSEVVGAATVTVTGEVKRPGTYTITKGERLSSLLRRAGGFSPDAFPKGAVFTRDSVRQRERQQLDKFVQSQLQAIVGESAATAAGAAVISAQAGEAAAQSSIIAQRRELLQSLSSAVTLGRIAIRVDAPERLQGTADDILLEGGDRLVIPQQPTSVLVIGAVRNSTSILWKDKENTHYYLNRAGGHTREADLDQTYILKADGSALASFVKLRNIEPGDAIVVPISTEPRYRTLPLIKDIATIVAGFAVPLGVIAAIAR